MVSRREFMNTVAVNLLAAPFAAEAQQAGKVYRIGYIFTGDVAPFWTAFVHGLNSLGWVEGKDIVFEYRQIVLPPSGSLADSRTIQQVAEEFVRIKVDVIVVAAAGWALFLQKMTGTIPIVVLSGGELVASGIVSSLARPGGYITGMQVFAPELQAKNLEILKELVPTLTRAADDAAKKLGLKLRYVLFRNSDELPGVFASMMNERDAALVIWTDPALSLHFRQIMDLAARHRLPTIADTSVAPKSGGLVGYSAKREDLYRQAATHVDRILKGAKPGDLPIGQPATFELVINLKTAKALGLIVPRSLLLRADEVIE